MLLSSISIRSIVVMLPVFAGLSTNAFAAGIGDSTPVAGADGWTFASAAPNVTHYGIGAGFGFEESLYRGYGAHFSPLPVLYFDNKWVHAFATTLDLKVGTWHDVSVTLRGKYALGDGYSGSDAPILNGMQTRNGAFWFGPTVTWNTTLGEASASILTSGNKGQQAEASFGKTFAVGRFSIQPHVGVSWQSSKYVDYYYGVRASEVRADRPFYTGKAAYQQTIGTRIDYRLTPHQMITLDVGVSHYSSGVTNSPLVGRKYSPEARFAYVYQFK